MEKKKEIDIIILSYAHNKQLKDITDNCISSLLNSEDPTKIKFNIILVESEISLKPYQYDGTATIYPDVEFGYNRYMNLGIDLTSSPHICICNNDLIFHNGWASSMLNAFEKYKLESGSPACSLYHPQAGYVLDGSVHVGYRVRAEVAGWCLFFKRSILQKMGKLDENFRFWCADNDYGNILWFLQLKHALVTSSVVDHLESKTLLSQPLDKQQELTYGEIAYWEKKWNYRMGVGWVISD
ncbi:Glycosyltransferase, GT2 family [Pedobacter westerhofensis]|uniref:Glycosyltransferase, GT2 family n=1 Tax=Pedobacter westerhofensis TaxID=425512 RepID=A0A521FTI9_9SPHI|nr:glycosyltransferase [Pedobacter westerhofensis]SMO98850.1 Glycosyltransferase, GT2 family [Pedobacter westerhofensis]